MREITVTVKAKYRAVDAAGDAINDPAILAEIDPHIAAYVVQAANGLIYTKAEPDLDAINETLRESGIDAEIEELQLSQ